MTFVPPDSVQIFITTEDDAAGIDLSSTPATATTTSVGINNTASLGIASLGAVTTSSDSDSEIPYIEGIDVSNDYEDDPTTFFGGQKEYPVEIRKAWEITLTIKKNNEAYGRMFGDARFGAKDASTLYTGLEGLDGDAGYRVYVYDGQAWHLFYHGLMTPEGRVANFDSGAAVTEEITLKGNLWKPAVDSGNLATSQSLE